MPPVIVPGESDYRSGAVGLKVARLPFHEVDAILEYLKTL